MMCIIENSAKIQVDIWYQVIELPLILQAQGSIITSISPECMGQGSKLSTNECPKLPYMYGPKQFQTFHKCMVQCSKITIYVMGQGFQTFHKCMRPMFQYSHKCMGPGFQTFQGPVFQRSHKCMGGPRVPNIPQMYGSSVPKFPQMYGPRVPNIPGPCSKVLINVWPQGSRLSTNMWSINVWAQRALYHCMVQHSTNEVARFCTQIQGAAACSSRLYRHIDLDYSVHSLNVCDTTFRLCMIIL